MDEIQNLSFCTILGVDGSNEDGKNLENELLDTVWEEFAADDLVEMVGEDHLDEAIALIAKEDDTTSRDFLEKLAKTLGLSVEKLQDAFLAKLGEFKKQLFLDRINGLQMHFTEDSSSLEELEKVKNLWETERFEEALALAQKIAST